MRQETYKRLQERSRREDYNRGMRREDVNNDNAPRADYNDQNYNRQQNFSSARSDDDDRRGYSTNPNERGWLEKASDEVSSWFGGSEVDDSRRTDSYNRNRGANDRDRDNVHRYQASYTPKEANPYYTVTNRIDERDDRENRRNDNVAARNRDFSSSAAQSQRSFYGGGATRGDNRHLGGNQQQNRWRDWHDTRAGDLMTRNVSTVQPQDTAQYAARLMRDEDCGALPVVDQRGRMIGMITDRDITVRLVADGADPRFARVQDCMTDEVYACHVNDPIEGCMRSMKQHQIRRMVIVDDHQRVLGIISQGDLARHADSNQHRGERRAFTDMVAEISEESTGAYR